jgi:hypothetical protein
MPIITKQFSIITQLIPDLSKFKKSLVFCTGFNENLFLRSVLIGSVLFLVLGSRLGL